MSFFFFFNDTATTEIYTLSLHDALPILMRTSARGFCVAAAVAGGFPAPGCTGASRSEEHTSELQSHSDLVCRLLLEKKKKKKIKTEQQKKKKKKKKNKKKKKKQ